MPKLSVKQKYMYLSQTCLINRETGKIMTLPAKRDREKMFWMNVIVNVRNAITKLLTN